MEKIRGNTETSIYIIDKDYRILHFNKALKRIFPQIDIGDICYEVLCGQKEPCSECPLKKVNNDDSVFFNQKVQQWIEVSTGLIEWPGAGTANIIFSRAVYEENKNLFYNLTNTRNYDELLEMNLTKGTYKILYHNEGKYAIPDKEGKLEDLIGRMSEQLICKEDKDRFCTFWNLKKMIPDIMQNPETQMLSAQFRKKLVNGGYGWVTQRIVPLLRGEDDDKIIMCFVHDIQEQKDKEIETGETESDKNNSLDAEVGLYRRSAFLAKAETMLRSVSGKKYCLMTIDIEHFKLFNEWYGHEAGDEFLKNIGAHLREAQDEHGGLAGYMGDDDFCIILPNDKVILMKLQNQIMSYIKRYGGNAGFLPAFGIYEISDSTLPVGMMYDRAVMALASVKGNYAQRVCWYDAGMMQKMKDDHKLLTEVQKALEDNEFTFYVQPKCDMQTGKIVGLESLIRWIHPTRGLIKPGEFIPLLESNGFIANLDMFVWEQVCICLKEWIDRGRVPIPISVNVSRMDLYVLDVPQCFKRLVKKYGLEPRLVEVEITESAYAEEYDVISEMVDELREAGFTVLMDDFGSGYSSLNMLKDVNVDILKIDMKFLNTNESNGNKGMEILEVIIRMAQLMGLRVIAEGVETKEQVDMLWEMGCAYSQGYYFYHPMPREEIEKLLEDEDNVDYRGIEFRQCGRFEKEWTDDEVLRKLTRETQKTAEAIWKQMNQGGMVGGFCEDGFPLYFADNTLTKMLGYLSYEEFERAIDGKVINTIHPDDREQVKQDIGDKYYVGLEYTTTYRMPKKDGSFLWVLDKGKVIRSEDGRLAIVSMCVDISDSMRVQMQLDENKEELNFLNNDVPGGYHRCLPTEDCEFAYISSRFLQIFGYTREEIKELFDNKYMNMVHPEDRPKLNKGNCNLLKDGGSFNMEYRMLSKKGYIWVVEQSKYTEVHGEKCIQGIVFDVTEAAKLRNQMKILKEHAPENIFLCRWKGQDVFKEVLSRGLHKSLGYAELGSLSEEEMVSRVMDKEEYERLLGRIEEAVKKRRDYYDMFQEKMPDGKRIWVSLEAKCISAGPETIEYLFFLSDVTYIKHKERELRMTGQKLESILRQARINCWDWDIEQKTLSISNVIGNKVLEAIYPAMKQEQAVVKDMPRSIMNTPYIKGKYKERFCKYVENVFGGKDYDNFQCEFPVTGKNGETAWYRTACETICNENGKTVRAVGYYTDITEQKNEYLRSKENIKALQKDALTGLYNRQAAIPEIKKYLEHSEGRSAAMIMFDMDNFKVANDVFGHAYGDEIISESAERLRGFFREDDIVCRIGGDEFLVLCKNIQESDIERKLSSVVQAMKIFCNKGGCDMVFTVSAGYALVPEDGTEFDELYRKADVALFTAKMSGKGIYKKYSPMMKEIRCELAGEK